MKIPQLHLMTFFCVVSMLLGNAGSIAQEVDFRADIQPILANHCYACHGPDESDREADLRLDDEASARSLAIVTGRPDESPLIDRIETDDESEMMPPPEFDKPLTADQKRLLRAWIEQGARWQGHWAFDPIASPTPPNDGTGWSRNEIDRFVLARMKEAGLHPAAQADKATLLRRVYFDLIGIGPTPEAIEAFIKDEREGALERVVDELLASPHYGEHMAVGWLDAARFADTNGYQNDFVRSMWPWRDWVIQAFNDGMPFDQFIVEQIAGDMLADPTESQLIGSGFNRNNHSVTEGGSIDEEWRIENCVDRVETTSATFLGLTMGCARCHEHKYDPISQKDFYRFFAFFNNVDEQGVYTETRGNTGPTLKVPTQEQLTELAEVEAKLATLNSEIESRESVDTNAILEEWEKSAAGKRVERSPVFEFVQSRQIESTGWSPGGQEIDLPGSDSAVEEVKFPDGLTFERDQAFSWSAWVHGNARGAIWGQMDEDDAYRGADGIILEDGKLKVHLISAWRENAIAVVSSVPLTTDRWNHVTVTYDGKSKAGGYRIYFDGRPVKTSVDIDKLSDTTATRVPFRIGQRNHSEFMRGRVSSLRFYDSELSAPQVLQGLQQELLNAVERPNHEQQKTLAEEFVRSFDAQELKLRLAELQGERNKLINQQQTTMIMRERPDYRPTYLLRRGQYDLPDDSEALWPAIPAALPGLSADQPPNRLGLAQWMIDNRNPLVARVIVNRVWARLFGRGIVESVDNFGLQGTPPTHPLLLDWLADDFRQHGWDLKRLQKQILMSATYQQSSAAKESRERDPGNRWYARGPRYRMSAEQIRDHALASSGLLVERVGGPSVFPYQPDGLWEELAGGANNGPYKRSSGDDLYRRSLYTYRKRTVSHPTTATFDAPAWEICQVKRSRTNTPLQALALLNDTTYVEAARKLAERAISQSAEVKEAVTFAFRLAVSRSPATSELEELTRTYDDLFAYYAQDTESAKQLIAVGESKSADFPPEQLAAMTGVASILLNMDETITKH